MAHILHQCQKPGFLPIAQDETLDFSLRTSAYRVLLRMVQDMRWGILKGTFGVLLSVVLFIGSPFGIGAHSEPASSPQVAYQGTQTETLTYPESIDSPSTTYRAALNTTVLASSSPTVNCDPSYPDFCIAPSLPDLNCSDISYRNFTVRQPDPHKFARDKDGIGCES